MSETFHRITVNLTSRADAALKLAMTETGDSQTDTVNRAVQAYAYLQHAAEEGGTLYVQYPGRDEVERIRFL